jgi:hypothetical protein
MDLMGKFETRLQYQVWDSFFTGDHPSFTGENPSAMFVDSSGTTTVFQPTKEFFIVNYFSNALGKSVSVDVQAKYCQFVNVYRIEHNLVVCAFDDSNQVVLIDRKSLKVVKLTLARDEEGESVYFQFAIDHFPKIGYFIYCECGFIFLDENLDEKNRVEPGSMYSSSVIGLKDDYLWFNVYWDEDAIGFQIYNGNQVSRKHSKLGSP